MQRSDRGDYLSVCAKEPPSRQPAGPCRPPVAAAAGLWCFFLSPASSHSVVLCGCCCAIRPQNGAAFLHDRCAGPRHPNTLLRGPLLLFGDSRDLHLVRLGRLTLYMHEMRRLCEQERWFGGSSSSSIPRTSLCTLKYSRGTTRTSGSEEKGQLKTSGEAE